MELFKKISNYVLSYKSFDVVGMQLGLKSTLFDHLLVEDSRLLLFGFGFVAICIWIYTSSVTLTVSTLLAVIFSLCISYAIYTFVFRITFFPFMNLLGIVVAVGKPVNFIMRLHNLIYYIIRAFYI